MAVLDRVAYKEMELLMRGYMTTDGNFSNQAGRTFAARDRGRTAAVKTSAAYTHKPTNAVPPDNRAYTLPESFDRLSSIVSQNDIENWSTSEEQQYSSMPTPSTTSGRKSAYNAAQTAYGQQTAYSQQAQQAVQQAQAQQTASSAKNTGKTNGKTKNQEALLGGTLTEEELALLEEEKKKGSKSYGFDEDDIEHMNNLLEKMQRARERNKTNNDKKTEAKKVLRYQFKRVSGTISKAKTITQAGTAVSQARSALISIRKKGASGQYDPNEIAMAESHARKMVRIAKGKLADIKMEEASEKYGSKDEISVEYRKLVKKSHRKEEDMELLKADMDYLKAQIKYIKSGGRPSALGGYANSSSMSTNTAIQTAYIMKKEALKENLEEFLKNGEFASTAYEMASDVAKAVSDAPVSAGGTISASSVAPLPSSSFR